MRSRAAMAWLARLRIVAEAPCPPQPPQAEQSRAQLSQTAFRGNFTVKALPFPGSDAIDREAS